jgi:hypothetical protein
VAKGSILEGAKTMLTGMIDFLTKNTENIKKFFENIKLLFERGFFVIKEVSIVALNFLETFWKNNGDRIKSTVSGIITAITNFWKKYGDDIKIVL